MIFEQWHDRYGQNDEFEELRVSIIEGDIDGEEEGYSVHISSDPEKAIDRYRAAGFAFDDDLLVMVSRINRMNPPPNSNNLEMFKSLFPKFKVYYLAPGVISSDGKDVKPLFELGILKSRVSFRQTVDIKDGDLDSVVIKTAQSDRGTNHWM